MVKKLDVWVPGAVVKLRKLPVAGSVTLGLAGGLSAAAQHDDSRAASTSQHAWVRRQAALRDP